METYSVLEKLKETIKSDFRGELLKLSLAYVVANVFTETQHNVLSLNILIVTILVSLL